MKIEEYVIAYLGSVLDVPVSGDVPEMDTLDAFITVEKSGSNDSRHIRAATIAVQSWARSRAEAAALNETVIYAMTGITEKPEICRVDLNTDYNYPDLTRNKPRYQAVFEIMYYT